MTDTIDFTGFGLSDHLVASLTKAGFTTPTPIQAQAIGPQIEGRDILGVAQTGTGKTAAFGLPILNRLLALRGRPAPKTCRALILAPTRELAVQIQESLRGFAGGARVSIALVLGGVSRSAQIRQLSRGVDIVVATPGRLTDLLGERHLRLDETVNVVLDEADRMLDMGFIRDVRRIVDQLHPRRQSALFSATMESEVAKLAESLLNDPVRVSVKTEHKTVDAIAQQVEILPKGQKRGRLAELLGDPAFKRVIVFARTKRGADRVAENLITDGFKADAIHGNKSQNARQRALNGFRNGRVNVLVATDIAARGIDVPGITHVINHDLPDEPESYVHRIGRTGRNGATGVAITLCDPDERDKLRAVERLTRLQLDPDGDAPLPRKTGKPRRRRGGPNGNGGNGGAANANGQNHRQGGPGKPAVHGGGRKPGGAGAAPGRRRRPRRAAA